jgi:CARDB
MLPAGEADMSHRTAAGVVAAVICATVLGSSSFQTGLRAGGSDQSGGPGPPRRIVPARALAKALAVHGPFVLTGKDLDNLPPADDVDESLAGHEFAITPGASAIPSRANRPDGLRHVSPEITTFDPGMGAQDPQIAVSATHILLSGWDRWHTFTKDGARIQTVKASTFFADLIPHINSRLNVPDTDKYGIDHFFDTRLVYDDYRHRFWVMTLAKQKSTDDGITKTATNEDLSYRRAKVLVGVSATDDPTGDWYRYWWDGIIDDGICNAPDAPIQTVSCPGSPFRPGDGHDYAFIGISKWHFMETNITTRYAYLSVASASHLASGKLGDGGIPAWQYGQIQYSDDGKIVADSILQPAVHHGPDSASGSWLLNLRTESSDDDRVGKVYLWFLSAGPGQPILGTAPLSFGVAQMASAEQAPHDSIPEPRRLWAFPGHFVMKAVWRAGDLYAVIPDCQKWPGATECMAAIKLLRFGAFGDTGRPVIDRTFGWRNAIFDPPDALFSYFMPAIEVNGSHHMAMVYQRSGPTIWPEVRLTLRFANHNDNRPSVPIHFGEFPVGCNTGDHECAGEKENETKPVRSIDNSAMAVDPFDDDAIWMFHAYGYPPDGDESSTKGGWKTVVAKVFGRPHPDVAVRAVRILNPPPVVGGAISAEATVRNQGDGPASSVTVSFFLSSTSSINDPTHAVALGHQKVSTIDSGGLFTPGIKTSIPSSLPPGRYYLVVVAGEHSGNVEYGERNNSSASDPFEVPARSSGQ